MAHFDTCYLVINEFGIDRMTKRRGRVLPGEIAIRVAITLPAGAFDEPAPVTLEVPPTAIIQPAVQVAAEGAE